MYPYVICVHVFVFKGLEEADLIFLKLIFIDFVFPQGGGDPNFENSYPTLIYSLRTPKNDRSPKAKGQNW